MYNSAFLEIGNGYYCYWRSSSYRRYSAMDLGGSGTNITWLDPAKETGNQQFYRLLIRQP
jgi:hypothetical protein